ncbi:MAG: hypothetical protein V1899_04690, partial [Planctomycetota bacterium]
MGKPQPKARREEMEPQMNTDKHRFEVNKINFFGNEVEKGRGDVSVDKAPFPLPASRTGQADFPHPALPQNFTAQSLQQ